MKMRALILSLSIFASTGGDALASGAAAGQAKFGYLQAFRETMNRLIQADNEMYTQMQIIARRLEAFYRKKGHLPHEGAEQENFKTSVQKVLGANPYHPQTTELYYGMNVQDDGRIKMYFLNDSFLNADKAREYKKAAPAGWTTDPGNIMVMVNGEGTYLIWAAGADRTPLRDYERNNKTRFIFHDLSVEFANQ